MNDNYEYDYYQDPDYAQQPPDYPAQPYYEGQPSPYDGQYQPGKPVPPAQPPAYGPPYQQGAPVPPETPPHQYGPRQSLQARRQKGGLSHGQTILLVMGIGVGLLILQILCLVFLRRPGQAKAAYYFIQIIIACAYSGLGYYLCREKTVPPIVGAILGFFFGIFGIIVVIVFPDKPLPRSRYRRPITYSR